MSEITLKTSYKSIPHSYLPFIKKKNVSLYEIYSKSLGLLAWGSDLDSVIKKAKENYRIKVPGIPGDVYWDGIRNCFLVLYSYSLHEHTKTELINLLYRNNRDKYIKNIPDSPLLPPFDLKL